MSPFPTHPSAQLENWSPSSSVYILPHIRPTPTFGQLFLLKRLTNQDTSPAPLIHSCGSFPCQYWDSQHLCSLWDPKSHEERVSVPLCQSQLGIKTRNPAIKSTEWRIVRGLL